MDRPLVTLDTETARLGGPPHLIEIGAVRAVGGEVVDHFQALVRPAVEIEPEASAIHGLRDDDVADAEPAQVVLERFFAWLGDDWMAAHNAPFDARVLAFECARARLDPPRAPLLDTLRLARKLLPEAPDHKLETLCEFLGLEEGEHHRALPDAVWCWKTLEACLERAGERLRQAAERAGEAWAGGPTLATLLALQGGAPVTLAAWAPTAGALKPKLRGLERALGERRRVTLWYGDREGPPARLEVVPWVLFRMGERAYLEAECGSSGLLKTYRLDRIQRVDGV